MYSTNKNLRKPELSVHMVNCMVIQTSAIAFQTQKYWNLIGRSITTTLPVLSSVTFVYCVFHTRQD
jgi:hypothetical protein